MIIIKSDSEIDLMRESGKVTGFILKETSSGPAYLRPILTDLLSRQFAGPE